MRRKTSTSDWVCCHPFSSSHFFRATNTNASMLFNGFPWLFHSLLTMSGVSRSTRKYNEWLGKQGGEGEDYLTAAASIWFEIWESWIRRKKFPTSSEKKSILKVFQAKQSMTIFLVINSKKFRFSLELPFLPFTPTFWANFSPFLQNRPNVSNILSVQNRL